MYLINLLQTRIFSQELKGMKQSCNPSFDVLMQSLPRIFTEFRCHYYYDAILQFFRLVPPNGERYLLAGGVR